MSESTASRIRSSHMHGSQVSACLNQSKPPPTKNHLKENVNLYRQKALFSRAEKEREEKEKEEKGNYKKFWKMEAYRGAESKVRGMMNNGPNVGNNLNGSTNTVPISNSNSMMTSSGVTSSQRKNINNISHLNSRPSKTVNNNNVQQLQHLSQSHNEGQEHYIVEKNIPSWGDAGPENIYNTNTNQNYNDLNSEVVTNSSMRNNIDNHNPLSQDTYSTNYNMSSNNNSYPDYDMASGHDEEQKLDDFLLEAEKLKAKFGQQDINPTHHSVGPTPSQSLQRNTKTKIPLYLQKMKAERAALKQQEMEESIRKREQPPDGYRVLSEEERLETLAALKIKYEEVEKAHRRLPLKVESEAQKGRQREIHAKLKEIEDALVLFSKPRVVVNLEG